MQNATEWWRAHRLELLSLALAVAAAWTLYAYLVSLRQTENVIVAMRDLPAGTRLEPGDYGVAALPSGAAHALSVRQPEEAHGRILLARVRAGAMLLAPDLALPGAGSPVAAQLLPGERGVYIPWPASGSYPVEPGDMVDIVAVWDAPHTTSGADLLTAARVLVVDEGDITGSGGIVAAVPAQSAADVVAALSRGTLHAVIRPLLAP